MNKKIIAMITTLTFMITMMVPIMGASNGDNWQDDNAPWNISISNAKLLGSYQLGTSKEFQLEYYPSGSVGLKAIRHLEITGDSEVSDFEYYENEKWNDISTFSSEITFNTTTMQKVRVTFHQAGIYTVKFWATSISGEQSIVSKRVISVSDEGIMLYVEQQTTTAEIPTDETTGDVPTHEVPSDVTTAEITSDQPTTKEMKTTEALTKGKTIKVGKTKIKKAAKKKSAKKAKISLKKVKNASGYQIKISTSSKFSKKKTITKITKKTNYTVKKLKQGRKYYVKARAFIKKGKTRTYGKWCNKKKIKFTK